ncbi:MAG: CPBP family intramembrane metalloprotease [Acidimicrobiia bacterium]|nr:CPBP family intramembrane metalloprotease [Acidimicrobiia bacterium]
MRARPIPRVLVPLVGVLLLTRLLLDRVLPRGLHPPVHLLTAAVCLGLARAAGTDGEDTGLACGSHLRSLGVGTAVGGALAAGIALSSGHARVRELLVDPALEDVPVPTAGSEMLLRIPLNTALYEELVFRGALLGLGLRHTRRTWAVLVSSLLFGLWHALPADDAAHAATAEIDGPRTAAIVGATSAAGILFAGLRLWTGSVVAPVVVHAAVNSAAYATAVMASRRESAGRDDPQGSAA